MANSRLRLYLLYYKSVSDRFEKKLKLISHIKCTILPEKSVSYTHNYKLSGMYPDIYFTFRPNYLQMTMLSVTDPLI